MRLRLVTGRASEFGSRAAEEGFNSVTQRTQPDSYPKGPFRESSDTSNASPLRWACEAERTPSPALASATLSPISPLLSRLASTAVETHLRRDPGTRLPSVGPLQVPPCLEESQEAALRDARPRTPVQPCRAWRRQDVPGALQSSKSKAALRQTLAATPTRSSRSCCNKPEADVELCCIASRS